jgi:fucose 4-O-acetylase-like acetyltransferase
MSQATESLFTENHEYFFNSIGRARNAGKGEQAKSYHRIFDLGKNRKLYIFAACVFLFQFADASLLPIVGQNLAQSATEYASVLMAGLIVVPQVVVALLSPWVGYYSEKWGRKPLLLLGFGLEIILALRAMSRLQGRASFSQPHVRRN